MSLFENKLTIEFKRKSNLTKGSLEKILDVFKEISKIADRNEALKQVDNILYQIIEKLTPQSMNFIEFETSDEETYSDKKPFSDKEIYSESELMEMRQECQKDFEKFENEINVLSEQIYEDDFGEYLIYSAKNNLEFFGSSWAEIMVMENKHKLKEFKKIYESKIIEIETQYYKYLLQKTLTIHLFSISSIESVLSKIEESEKHLKSKKKLDEESLKTIRISKERISWFRAKKKLNEAEVAKGGQNLKKYDKLVGEAKVLLEQDWNRIFPNENPPEIDI